MVSSNLKYRSNSMQAASSFSPVANGEKDYEAKQTGKGCALSCIRKIEGIQCGSKPIITGIEQVVYGTQPAAELVSFFGVRPPRYLFYMMSGIVCDVIQFLLDIILHFAMEIKDPSVCWGLGFFMSIVFRHTSHRYLVFGDYVGGKKLAKEFSLYFP